MPNGKQEIKQKNTPPPFLNISLSRDSIDAKNTKRRNQNGGIRDTGHANRPDQQTYRKDHLQTIRQTLGNYPLTTKLVTMSS